MSLAERGGTWCVGESGEAQAVPWAAWNAGPDPVADMAGTSAAASDGIHVAAGSDEVVVPAAVGPSVAGEDEEEELA